MSDKEIVEQSTLLDYLLPGVGQHFVNYVTEHVCCYLNFLITCIFCRRCNMADRGFTCDEYAMAQIKTPPITKGKKQLEKVEIEGMYEV